MPQEFDLTMPLRDLFRGIGHMGRRADALGALPGALRGRLKELEARVASSLKGALTLEDIAQASAWLQTGKGSDAAFLKTLAHLWDRACSAREADGPIYSELLAQRRLAALEPALHGPAIQGPERAIAAWRALRSGHIFGPAPGLPLALSAEDQDHVDTTLAAILIWCMAERESTLAAESWLFDLATVLATNALPDLRASDGAALAALAEQL